MPRHKQPDILISWRDGPPKMCHTCEYYDEDGVCQEHQQEPPEEFAASPDACQDWLEAIPF